MKRTLPSILFVCIVMLTGLVFSSHTPMHSESVGQIAITQYKDQLYARATLDKRHLALALQNEGDCPPATMLADCATKYVEQNINISVNGQPVRISKQQQELEQHHVVITYKLHAPLNDNDHRVNSVSVGSTYMLAYNDHAVMKVTFGLNETVKRYTMSAQRQKIDVRFD